MRLQIVLEGGLMTEGTFTDGQWRDASLAPRFNGAYYQIDLSRLFDAVRQRPEEYMLLSKDGKANLPARAILLVVCSTTAVNSTRSSA